MCIHYYNRATAYFLLGTQDNEKEWELFKVIGRLQTVTIDRNYMYAV